MAIIRIPLEDINLNDPFFNSLRIDYPLFDEWFLRRVGNGDYAYVTYDYQGNLGSFLLLKVESKDDYNSLDLDYYLDNNVLKISSFKVLNTHQGIGTSYIDIINEVAMSKKVGLIYITVYPKYGYFIEFLERHNFQRIGYKDKELVLKKLVPFGD